MSPFPRVGVALIVRDEAGIIEQCLASFAEHVDVIAILDTGSDDGTLDVARAWCESRRVPLVTGVFEWCDDFAAARQAADALLDGLCEWKAWIDADDVLHGAQHLRTLAAQAPPGLAAYGADYDYFQNESGACVCRLKRERLVRAGAGRWTGRVHEAQLLDGPVHWVDPALVEWRHHKTPEAAPVSSTRNRAILHAWLEEEPTNPRVLAYVGTEELAAGAADASVEYFERYLEQPAVWPHERAQVRRKLAMAMLALGDVEAAERAALAALSETPDWPDTYLSLAEVAYQRRQWPNALHWARQVLAIGQPDTLLIIDPTDYSGRAHVIAAGALGELGHLTEAVASAELALTEIPGHQDVATAVRVWRARLKRDTVARQVVTAAQVLVGHDEQAKALTLLEECVPYFCVDHPDVVACRSQVRERLAWLHTPAEYSEHYVVGGSKPEDFCDDQESLAIADALPRAHFLLAGLHEQGA